MNNTRIKPILYVTTFLALLALCSVANSQSYIVDAAGGPGHHFKDLANAVATVADGATLRVRPGTYSGFTLKGKCVSIIGDDRNKVILDSGIYLDTINSKTSLIISDLTVQANQSLTGGVVFNYALSPVFLNRVTFQGYYCNVSIRHSRSVNFENSLIDGGFLAGEVRLDNSFVRLIRCTVSNMKSPDGFRGDAGIVSTDSTLFISESTVTGGAGGDGYWSGYWWISGGDGGTGIRLMGKSALTMIGGSAIGGKGGACTSCTGGIGGDALYMESKTIAAIISDRNSLLPGNGSRCGNQYRTEPGAYLYINTSVKPATLHLAGIQNPGSQVTFQLTGTPGSFSVLLLGVDPINLPITPYGFGFLFLVPVVIQPCSPIPGNGFLSLPLQITQGWPRDWIISCQFLVAEPPPGILWATNPVTILVKS